MTTLHAFILGVIQGLTEFLPVSSSAHLTFAEQLFNIPSEWRVSYDVLLHLGTTLALVVFFFRRIIRIVGGMFSPDHPTRQTNWNLVLTIAVATIPAAIAGYLLKEKIDALFETPLYSAVFLLVTGLVLFLTRRTCGERTAITWADGLVIGVAQAIAILPGISRSGSTIAAALFLGLARPEAFEFSLLLSIPAVLGAALLKLRDSPLIHGATAGVSAGTIIIGFGLSFLVGLLALAIVRRVLLRKRFWWFAFYCWIVGALALVLSLTH
jgi:undecaprenyl-diphosphatase